MEKPIEGLDRLDKELLYWLDLNCRESLSSLGRKMHASPAKVGYRMAQLVKSGAINSFITLVDYRKLGLRGYAVYFKMKEMGEQELRRRIELIKGVPNLADLILTSGAYDLHVAFLVSTTDDAAQRLEEVRGILEDCILDEMLLVYLRAQFFSREHFLDKAPPKDVKPRLVLDSHEEHVKIDKVDMAILSVMAENADWPVWKIAKAAKVAGPTAYNRIKRLEKNGVIVGYSAKMSPNMKGNYFYRVLVKLRHMSPKKKSQLSGFLDSHPSIYRSTFTLGRVEMQYDVRISDETQLRDLLRQVYEHFKDEVVLQDWVRVYEIIRFGFYYSSKK
ncbi:MAG: AsnC family transcriptional regulator [Candidatus Micrarchaeota archaeon]